MSYVINTVNAKTVWLDCSNFFKNKYDIKSRGVIAGEY